MIIEITLGVIGGSAMLGVFIHQLSKSLHSSNHQGERKVFFII